MYTGETLLRSDMAVGKELWTIASTASANEQWAQLDRIAADRLEDPDLQLALVDYAADASTGVATIVRMRALDMGLQGLVAAYDAGGRAALTSAQQGLFDQTVYLIPEFFMQPQREESSALEPSTYSSYAGTSVHIASALSERAGLDKGLIFSPAGTSKYRPHVRMTTIPVAPIMLMNHLVDEGKPSGSYLSRSVMEDAAALALDYRSPRYQEAVNCKKEPTGRVPLFTRLGRLTREGGIEHASPIDTLYALPDKEALPFALAMNRLHKAASNLDYALPFPDLMTPFEAVNGVRRLMANALFGLQHFVEHGNGIDTAIGWPDNEARFVVQEDDPLFLLDALTRTLQMVRHAYRNLVPEAGPTDSRFHQYRMVDPEAATPPQVLYHGRGQGGEQFDPRYEFIGQATARWRVQHHTEQAIPFENALQMHNTVSVRADYDKYGFAIDVGALPVNPYNGAGERDLEVRLGRFMALGNFELSRQLGLNPTMHHVRLLPPGEDVEKSVRQAIDRRHLEFMQRAAGIPRPLWWLEADDAVTLRLLGRPEA